MSARKRARINGRGVYQRFTFWGWVLDPRDGRTRGNIDVETFEPGAFMRCDCAEVMRMGTFFEEHVTHCRQAKHVKIMEAIPA
jgi:hypothetical protein